MATTVTVTGPLFTGAADRLTEQACADLARDLAETGDRLVHANLTGSLRHPTGFYQSHVQATGGGRDWQINDSGVIYGPWLEGVGSRNRTTRFKGYASFRRAGQELQHRAPSLADAAAAELVRKIG
jgi:hypothetical protein